MKGKRTDDESNVNGNDGNSDEKNGKTKEKTGGKTKQKDRKGWVELDSDEESLPEKNVFANTLVTEAKRKRPVSNVNELAEEWITDHLQAKAMVRLSFTDLYEYYVGDSMARGQVVEEKDFKQLIKKTFPDGFAFKDDSPLKYEVKEMKMADKTKKKAQGETTKLKMHDVLDVVLRELGNPKTGIRFHKINLTAATKYPALRLHLRPFMMLGAIDRGLRKQQIICTKGIGKCGFYRLATPDGADGDQATSDGATGAGDDESSVPLKKRKRESGSGDTEGEGDGERISLARKAGEKSTKRKDGEKKAPTPSIGKISHSNPRHITHVFPMAFTFQSEPKMASIKKVRDYVRSYYPQEFRDSTFTRVLEEGFGFSDWTRVSGKGMNGSVQLTLDAWNPKYDDKMRDLIINAIIACNEPKQCGSTLIRQYIEEFHPRFKVQGGASKGKFDRFRKAWQKAIDCGLIVQLSGIGLSGTFQLNKTFEPSPANLAGEESDGDSEDEGDEESSEDSSDDEDQRKSVSRGRLRRQVPKGYADDLESEEEKYLPRSHVTSRSRSNQKKSDKQSGARNKTKVTSRSAALKKSGKTSTRQSKRSSKHQPSSNEEDNNSSDDEDGGRVNIRRRKTATPAAAKKKVNTSRSKRSRLMVKLEPLSDDKIRSSSSSDDDDVDRGVCKRRKAKSSSLKKSENSKTGRKRRSKQSDEEDDDDSEVESTTKRKTVSPQKKGKSKQCDEEDDDESEVEFTKKRKTVSPQKKGKSKQSDEEDDDESEVESTTKRKTVSPQKKGKFRARRR